MILGTAHYLAGALHLVPERGATSLHPPLLFPLLSKDSRGQCSDDDDDDNEEGRRSANGQPAMMLLS